MTRCLTLLLLALALASPVATARASDPPKAQQEFYKALARDFVAKNGSGIAARFDAYVNLRLVGSRLKRYRKDQAANVLRTYLRGITPVRDGTKIIKWTTGYMILRCRYWDSGGRLRETQLYFNAKQGRSGYVVTTISR